MTPIVMLDPGNFTPYYVDGLCRGLAEHGLRARVLTSPPLFEPIESGGQYDVEWVFHPWLTGGARGWLRNRRRLRRVIRGAAYPFGLWRVWRLLRTKPAGLLHIHWSLAPSLDRPLIRALRRRGWRIVYTLHDRLPEVDRGASPMRPSPPLSAMDAIIAHTHALAMEVQSAHPDLATRVHVVPHGASLVPPPSAADRADARQWVGVDADAPVLLFFGMIKPYKGLPFLIEALPAILAAWPRVRLVIAGEALMPMEPLMTRASDLGVEHAIIWRTHFVPTAEVPRYFAAADLMIAPHVELVAASGAMVLAQSYGLPVVATRLGGLPELVPPDCGWIVPPRSAPELANAVCTALADRPRLSAMGSAARARVARELDWRDIARQTAAIYFTNAIGARHPFVSLTTPSGD